MNIPVQYHKFTHAKLLTKEGKGNADVTSLKLKQTCSIFKIKQVGSKLLDARLSLEKVGYNGK